MEDEQGDSKDFDEYNKLSKRLYVKKLFKRIPQLSETAAILLRSKAHVKGKVGSRSELALGNANKVKTDGILEEPNYGAKVLFPGVFNGLHTIKHTKKRIIRELKYKLDLYAHSLSLQLKNILTFYEQLLRYVHPFQYTLLQTCLHDCYANRRAKLSFKQVLYELSVVKKRIIERSSIINAEISKVKKCRDAFNIIKTHIFELDEIYKTGEEYYSLYRWYSSSLRKLPVIDIMNPIVAIIGYVNIGKTTLFHKLLARRTDSASSNKNLVAEILGLKWSADAPSANVPKGAKIADYKFTTRSINASQISYKIGNFIYNAHLIDTPGLLWRENHKFNPHEKLTYSTLKDMPVGVLYAFDTSDEKLLKDEIKLYHSLRMRFPRRPWINVITKGEETPEIMNELATVGIDITPSDDIFDNLQTVLIKLHETFKSYLSKPVDNLLVKPGPIVPGICTVPFIIKIVKE